jgi:uncharacterized membrane protein YccF (DUF307 family)
VDDGCVLRLVLDILWLTLGGGFVIAIQYFLGGLLLCLTIVGIPFGVQCMKLAGLAAFPFGKDLHVEPSSLPGGPLRLVLNVLWVVVAGIWIFLSHLGLALASAITIIGIPFAVQHLKLAVLALWPFGRTART